MYDLEQLEQLVTFAQLGTLSQTAQVLHLSQPALSRSMQRLEENLEVQLFERHRNRLELNATGMLAAEYAKDLLETARKMTNLLRQYDKSQHSLTIGSCAPAPIWNLSPLLYRLFGAISITTELQPEEHLIQGVLGGNYQIAVTSAPITDDRLESYPFLEEQLCFLLPPEHPCSKNNGIYFEELNGETLLQMTNIGIWQKLPARKMPKSKILLQEEWGAYYVLLKSTAYPAFTSNLAAKYMEDMRTSSGRLVIPILDKEARIIYYCVYRKDMAKRIQPLLQELEMQHKAF